MTVLNDVKKGRAAYFWLKRCFYPAIYWAVRLTPQNSALGGERAAGKRTIGEG